MAFRLSTGCTVPSASHVLERLGRLSTPYVTNTCEALGTVHPVTFEDKVNARETDLVLHLFEPILNTGAHMTIGTPLQLFEPIKLTLHEKTDLSSFATEVNL